MDQEKLIKLTLAAQIAGQISKKYCETDKDEFINNVVETTVEIMNRLYERI